MHRACARFQARVWTDQAVSERLWRHERLVMREGVGSAQGPWLCDSREARWRIRFREWGAASRCIECTVAVRTTGDAGLLPAKCRLAALAAGATADTNKLPRVLAPLAAQTRK